MLRLPSAAGAPPLLRSYSLSDAPSEAHYRVSIKRNPGGLAGAYVAGEVRPGDIIELTAPRGGFTLQPGDGPVVLLSAGIGVTPVLAMLHALAAARSPRQIWWLHGARSRSEHAFAKEAKNALNMLDGAHRHVRYSAPEPGDRLGVDFDAAGRISAPVLIELGVPRDADFYLCGPAGFMADLSSDLVHWGVPSSRILTEAFGPGASRTPGIAMTLQKAPHLPSGPAGSGPLVSFARSGLEVRSDAMFRSLLELAEACDVPVRWACRTGVCHSCETALMAGSVSYQHDPVDPPADGNVLICCCQPAADVVIDL